MTPVVTLFLRMREEKGWLGLLACVWNLLIGRLQFRVNSQRCDRCAEASQMPERRWLCAAVPTAAAAQVFSERSSTVFIKVPSGHWLVGFGFLCDWTSSCWGFLAPELRSRDRGWPFCIEIFTIFHLLFTPITFLSPQPQQGSSTEGGSPVFCKTLQAHPGL